MGEYDTFAPLGEVPGLYSVKVPGTEEEGFSAVYVSPLKEKLKNAKYMEDDKTMWEFFQAGLKRNPDAPCIGKRMKNEDGSLGAYQFMTFKEVEDAAKLLGSSLAQLPIAPQPSDHPVVKDIKMVGLFLPNCVEWVLMEQGCNAYGYTLVPVYNTLGLQSIHTILLNSKLSVLVCSAETIKLMMRVLEQGMDGVMLTLIVLIGYKVVPEELVKNKFNLKFILWEDLFEMGKKKPLPVCPPHPDTLSIISYTSGTSGVPKGVMITHRNLINLMIATLESRIDISFPKNCFERHISYLPMAHLFEKMFLNMVLYNGGCVGLYSGDIKKLMDDIQEFKPTLFVGVPRLYQRIHDKVMAGVDLKPFLVKTLFMTGLAAKMENIKKNGKFSHFFWDKIVFNKVKKLLGGCVRWMFVGSSSMNPLIVERIRAMFGVPLIWGYALTESCAGTTTQHFNDTDPTHCGGPIVNQEFRLRFVPDMEYFADADPPKGELLLRGGSITHGYYRNEKITKETIINGWFYTGDIVEILPSGAIRVIDRAKNVFKLAQGEYISPEYVESIISLSPLVAQVVVFGRSDEVAPVAVVVPDEDTVKQWKAAHGMGKDNFEVVCRSDALREAILKDMDRLFTENGVRGYEKVKVIYVEHELFSVDNSLLTVTAKLRRHQLRSKYVKQIDEMYKEVRKMTKK
ncbi:long-chain-fatty-acid-CoA ligase [Babesia gibsoni]|uniref:Long-chain-fatty-acid-CoA ligase n=1 Tax=Babesia gibsoni TaxID=33632 RepID=A0AAD8LHZ8_BABGI|nr:long-chain-fatty-acid-CoA ligase [Babesia gibsoni]